MTRQKKQKQEWHHSCWDKPTVKHMTNIYEKYNFCFSVNQAFLRGLKQSVIPDTVREE